MATSRLRIFGLACFACLLQSLVLGTDSKIVVQQYKGKMHSSVQKQPIDAKWNIDWPVSLSGVSPRVLTTIRKQISLDAFGLPLLIDSNYLAQINYNNLDVVKVFFERAAKERAEIRSKDDPIYPIDFEASVKIKFITEGYLGYTLFGYENEGGGGCHSYTIARVISLTTGRTLEKSDFIATTNLPGLMNFIVKKACAERKIDPVPHDADTERVSNEGSFMLEKSGIRWYLPAYSVFGSADGVQSTLVSWDELEPFVADPRYLAAFRKLDLSGMKVKRIRSVARPSCATP